MKATNFYKTISDLVKSTPNNLELGDAVRKLIWKIEDSKKQTEVDPNQVTIFDEIKERQDEH